MACSVCGSPCDDVLYHDEFYCLSCFDNETCLPTDYPSEEDELAVQKIEDEAIRFERAGG
jgi:hypothetical protein